MNSNLEKFKGLIDKIAAFSERDDLIRRTDWGVVNFEEASSDVNTVVHMAVDLKALPVQILPDSVINDGVTAATGLIPQLEALQAFSITASGDINQRRSTLISNIHQKADAFNRVIGLWIPYLSYHRGDAEENIKKLQIAIEDVSSVGKKHLEELNARNTEAASLIEHIKSASAEAGVAVYTHDFSEEAKSNGEVAKTWLVCTIVLAVMTMLCIVGFYFKEIQGDNIIQVIPRLGCRLLLVSLFFTATIWCGRMYKAMYNQMIQNRHRALGLKTFRAFSEAAGDAQTKDAVLRETTHSIFSSTPTGLISDSSSGESDSNIVQIAGGMLNSATTK